MGRVLPLQARCIETDYARDDSFGSRHSLQTGFHAMDEATFIRAFAHEPKGFTKSVGPSSLCHILGGYRCNLHKVTHKVKPTAAHQYRASAHISHQGGCMTYEKRLSQSAISRRASPLSDARLRSTDISHLFFNSSTSWVALRSTMGSYCFTADVANARFHTRRASVCHCLSRAPMRPPFALDGRPRFPAACLPSHT